MRYLLIFLIALATTMQGYAQQKFNSFPELKNYVNTTISPNGMKSITGQKMNQAVMGGFQYYYDNYFDKTGSDTRFAFKNHGHPIMEILNLTDTISRHWFYIDSLRRAPSATAVNLNANYYQLIFRNAVAGTVYKGTDRTFFFPNFNGLTIGTNGFQAGGGYPDTTKSLVRGRNILSVGESNVANQGQSMITVGNNNSNGLKQGIMVGEGNNSVAGGDSTTYGVVMGSKNTANNLNMIVMGSNNVGYGLGTVVIGNYNTNSEGSNVTGANMFGNYLDSKYPNSVIVGNANSTSEIDSRIANVNSLAFAVGIGADAGSTGTGMIIDKGGAIWFPGLRDATNGDSILAVDINGKLVNRLSGGSSAEHVLSFTAPLARNVNAISIIKGDATHDGYISSTDWLAFNAKQAAITFANITPTDSKLTITGGTGAVKNAVTIALNESSLALNNIGGTLGYAKGGLGLTALGSAGQALRVKSDLSGYEFFTPSNGLYYAAGTNVTFGSQTGTSGDPIVINATAATSAVTKFNTRVGDIVPTSGDYTTDLVTEGSTNKYYLDTRARAALSATSPLAYNSSTGAFSMPAATSGQNGYLTSANFTAFNSKEPAITAASNLTYFRGDKTFQALTSDVVVEGTTNKFYTDVKVRTAISATSPIAYNNSTGVFSMPLATNSVDGYLSATDRALFNSREPGITSGTNLQYWRGDKSFQTLNTDVVPETGTNQYFTTVRSRNAISATGTGASYDPSTGVLTFTAGSGSGSSLPTTAAALRANTTPQTVLPYRISDPGAEGEFVYCSTCSALAEDGGGYPGTIIKAGNNARYIRLYDGTLNIRWFGGKPDFAAAGSTMTGTDNSAALARMMAAASDQQPMYGGGPGSWYFPTTTTWGSTKTYHLTLDGDVYTPGVTFLHVERTGLAHRLYVNGDGTGKLNLPAHNYTTWLAGTEPNWDALTGAFIELHESYRGEYHMQRVDGYARAIYTINGDASAQGGQENKFYWSVLGSNRVNIYLNSTDGSSFYDKSLFKGDRVEGDTAVVVDGNITGGTKSGSFTFNEFNFLMENANYGVFINAKSVNNKFNNSWEAGAQQNVYTGFANFFQSTQVDTGAYTATGTNFTGHQFLQTGWLTKPGGNVMASSVPIYNDNAYLLGTHIIGSTAYGRYTIIGTKGISRLQAVPANADIITFLGHPYDVADNPPRPEEFAHIKYLGKDYQVNYEGAAINITASGTTDLPVPIKYVRLANTDNGLVTLNMDSSQNKNGMTFIINQTVAGTVQIQKTTYTNVGGVKTPTVTTTLSSSQINSTGIWLLTCYGAFFTATKVGSTGSTGGLTGVSFGTTATANANGATLSGTTLQLQPATAIYPGGVSNTAQDFTGLKRFLNTTAANLVTVETQSTTLTDQSGLTALSTVAGVKMAAYTSAYVELGRRNSTSDAATTFYTNGRNLGTGRQWSQGMAPGTNNFYLFDEANGITTMVAYPNGNIRIGTSGTDPGVKLEVDGAFTSTGANKLMGLAGASTRMVTVLADGTLSSATIPTGGTGGGSYTFSGGLTDDGTGSVTNNLIVPTAGTKTVYGGTQASDQLILMSTSNATKTIIRMGNSVYNEANNRLGINTLAPTVPLESVGDARIYNAAGVTFTVSSTTSGVAKSRTEFSTTNSIEQNVTGNTILRLGRNGTSGVNTINFGNSPTLGTTDQWGMGTLSGSSDFTVNNLQGGTQALRVFLSSNNVNIGPSTSNPAYKLNVEGSIHATGTFYPALGTSSVAPFRFDAASSTTTSIAALGEFQFDGTSAFITGNLFSTPTKQTIITNLNNVDIAGNKNWYANPIIPGKIDGTAGSVNAILTTDGSAAGAAWVPNEGGFTAYAVTSSATSLTTLASQPMPDNTGGELEYVVVGYNNLGNTVWVAHYLRGYKKKAGVLTLNSEVSILSQSDFTPANGVSKFVSSGSFIIQVSSVGSEVVNWSGYVKVRPVFTFGS